MRLTLRRLKIITTKLLLIVGPTAVGKTDLSLKIAKKFNGEIISGDSMQIYRNLDIGTAKVSMNERKIIKHYLIDICNIDQSYSVADFIDQCQLTIDLIKQKRKLPMIVGGTGFYLQALLDDFHLGGIQSAGKAELRKKWEAFAQTHGENALWQQLNKIDPLAAKKIPPANQRRIIRALEVQQLTNKLFSAQHDFKQSNFDPLVLGLNLDRQALYQRINRRVDLMFQQGLLTEARWLYNQGPNLPAGKGIGYKELFPYFAGQTTLTAAKELIKKNSRHYAKRQLTWFRNKMTVTWLDPTVTRFEEQAFNKIEEWLQKG